MPATVRYDEQYCPIARALDVLGDRWTLLILRELVRGDQRFTDLRTHLPGIAATLLSQRLRTMAAQGLLESRDLPPPAARSVYTVTARGREALPVLRALARFGLPLLEAPSSDTTISPTMVADAALRAYFDAFAATGIDERYEIHIDDQTFQMSSIPGGGVDRLDPDLVVGASAATWMDIRQGRLGLRQAIKDNRMTKSGRASALTHFADIFHLA